jgi:acyl-CoA thioesterase FadM
MRLSEYSVYQFQIEFEDVDMAGVAFHGNYLSYVMRARMRLILLINECFLKESLF